MEAVIGAAAANSHFVRFAVVQALEMLHDTRTSGLEKLQRGWSEGVERRLRAGSGFGNLGRLRAFAATARSSTPWAVCGPSLRFA